MTRAFVPLIAGGLIIRSSIIRRRTDTDDHEVIARAWQAANDKARELGWIV